MRLLFLTGSRGEWGYIHPILKLCKRKGIQYNICATNMHLLPSFGLSVEEIRSDGFVVSDELYMALDGYNHYTMIKSMGIMLTSFADVLWRLKPDWVILAGDRAETLMGAIAASYTYTPVAHIQAGELSGNIDGLARHAIGKFAHLHFASNKDAEQRLIRLGEEPFRVHCVGAPQLDELIEGEYSTTAELKERLGVDTSRPYMLVIQHPVTEDFETAEEDILTTIKSVNQFDISKVWIFPNNDAGSDTIRKRILEGRKRGSSIFSNLPRRDFLGLLKGSACIVGNSSAGLLEAPSFSSPAVNIGRRQANRLRGKNVIDVPVFDVNNITNAIKKAISESFRRSLGECVNPYGDGHSSQRIFDILLSTPVDNKLLVKQLTY